MLASYASKIHWKITEMAVTRLKARRDAVGESERIPASRSWHPMTTILDLASKGYSRLICSSVLPVFFFMAPAISRGFWFLFGVNPTRANDFCVSGQ